MKKIVRKNLKVVITPNVFSTSDFIVGKKSFKSIFEIEEEELRQCKEIMEKIWDKNIGMGEINLFYDKYDVCSHCENHWEIDFMTGKPKCCLEAEQEWEKEKPHKGA